MDLSVEARREAFGRWLRTGRVTTGEPDTGIELKFNPYHDPFNGRFTFAPGGRARARERVAGGAMSRSVVPEATHKPLAREEVGTERSNYPNTPLGTAVGPDGTNVNLAPNPQMSRYGRGSNSRAFQDPMTLEHSFPGLEKAPGGAIVAATVDFLDIYGPADAAQIVVIDNQANAIIDQIKAVDPKWHYDELGPNTSVQGRINRLNTLRWQRAAALLKINGDVGPLQVETLRYVQRQADQAYDRGTEQLTAGRLKIRLSDREALGNYIDASVRRNLRARYNQLGIDSAGKGPVRVNRRENDRTGTELSYRRPDARVGDVAFDVTLTLKTLATPQVRGFFNTDFKPSRVVIIRPRQTGDGFTYAIPRPEVRK